MSDILNSKKRWGNAVAEYWRDNLRPPWRPSAGDVKNYGKEMKTIRQPENILILGATPELRDLAAKFGKKIWVVDYSPKMISEMSGLVNSRAIKKEKITVGDWLELKIQNEIKFDAILGDLVFRLIPPDKRHAFLRKIFKLLRPGGIFITRIHFIDESLKKKTATEIIDNSFSFLDPKIPGRGKEVENLLISRLLDKYFRYDLSRVKKFIRRDVKKYLTDNSGLSLNRKKILAGVLKRFEGSGMADFFPQIKRETERILNFFFRIKRPLTAGDYKDAEFFPIYMLKPKQRGV